MVSEAVSSRALRFSSIASIGECMVELGVAPDGTTALGFGGDTLNTAIYLARLVARQGVAVDYVTAVGRDPFSDRMVSAWEAEGVGTALVHRHPDRIAGLYAITTAADGERSFTYWRGEAAARTLFDAPDADFEAALIGHDVLYLSAISVAILPAAGRERLIALLERHRANGGTVAFDSNYRPRLWASKTEAQETVERLWRVATVAFPSVDDEMALFDEADEDTVIARLKGYGHRECILKRGPNGPLIVAGGTSTAPLAVPPPAKAVDTTAAGDSFNAGYLAARALGAGVEDAALAGHSLAATVIRHRGAIIPLAAMPA